MEVPVMLVVEETLSRNMLEALIEGSPGFRKAGSGRDWNVVARMRHPRRRCLILVGSGDRRPSPFGELRQIRETAPRSPVVIWSAGLTAEEVTGALRAGAAGVLSADLPAAELLDHLQRVWAGDRVLCRKACNVLLKSVFQPQVVSQEPLSPQEERILSLLASGKLYKEIAAAAGISFDTVHFHLKNVYRKLRTRSRTEATLKYLQLKGAAGLEPFPGDFRTSRAA